MKTTLNSTEMLIKKGPANLQKGVETVGGKLYLTTQRLIFEAHKLNIQGGITEMNLSEINSTKLAWTKFLGLIPLIPNSLSINLKKNEYCFVLFGRKVWQSSIDEQRMKI